MPDIFDKKKRSDIMRSVKNKDALPELIVQSLIRDLGIEYERNYKVLCCKPDIVISAIHKVIFIHGCFCMGIPANEANSPLRTVISGRQK